MTEVISTQMNTFKFAFAVITLTAAFSALAQEGVSDAQNAAQRDPSDSAAQGDRAAQEQSPEPDENGYYQGAGIFVSDNVNAMLRSGPAYNYRTVGVLHPGDQVIFQRYSQDKKFVEVQTSDNKKVWMRFNDLQPTPAARNQVDQLKAEVEELKKELEQAQSLSREEAPATDSTAGSENGNADDSEISKLRDELSSLKTQNDELKKALDERNGKSDQSAGDVLSSSDSSRRELDLQMRWWLQGAMIALGGAVAGIILVMLPKPRRKRRERY